MQRQYNVGLNSNPGTISLAVDKNRFPRLGPRGPERGWPGDSNLVRNRRALDELKAGPKGKSLTSLPPPPRYSPAYTSDVSHLVV